MSVVGVGANGEIASWMDRIAVKRNDLKGRRQRNLRAEAILGHAQVVARRKLDVRWTEYKGDRDHEAPNCGSVCDCETCVLCQRHFYTGHARCYCNEVFYSGAEMDTAEEDPEVCKRFEEFFAELDLATKRKRDDGDVGGRYEREAKRLRYSASS